MMGMRDRWDEENSFGSITPMILLSCRKTTFTIKIYVEPFLFSMCSLVVKNQT